MGKRERERERERRKKKKRKIWCMKKEEKRRGKREPVKNCEYN